MRIRREYLEKGGEIDFTANFMKKGQIGRGRVSLRKQGTVYQVYVKWYLTQEEEILYESSSLEECINYTNALFGYDDEIV